MVVIVWETLIYGIEKLLKGLHTFWVLEIIIGKKLIQYSRIRDPNSNDQ